MPNKTNITAEKLTAMATDLRNEANIVKTCATGVLLRYALRDTAPTMRKAADMLEELAKQQQN